MIIKAKKKKKGGYSKRHVMGPEGLFIAVIAQAVEDAFFLKVKKKQKKGRGKEKHTPSFVYKEDAITWLRGENDFEGLCTVCNAAGIPVDKVIKAADKYLSGEHIHGYEFATKKAMEDALGIKFRIVDRDLLGEDCDCDDRWEYAA